MATLVLSTVGTALGGPIGSAIGAVIGQSIDQQLLAPPRRGPRVGDLAVQTSTYGTQIPRLYGTMRVAGSVIWSTDLIENEQTDGAKGQPDVSYRYTVSLAVALSSRPVRAIKRIWADGKLLRGEAGDLKVGGTLRLLNGGDDQQIDPLIGSIEGIDSTPAYRGLALALFEDLELSEFGNRIPFLTFEVEADHTDPTCGEIMTDASAGAVAADAIDTVHGYAAYGRSIGSAIEPLVETFGIELVDDGEFLRSTSTAALQLAEIEFGNSADGDATPRLEREQLSARSVPGSISLNFYDPGRDYQSGEARASAGEDVSSLSSQELPAALSVSHAKSLAQRLLARAWSRREKLTLRLPRNRLALEPGAKIELPLSPGHWTVEQVMIEGFVSVVELRPATLASAAMTADAGRIVPNVDVVAGPISLALLDVPALPGVSTDQPTILLAATQAQSGWKAHSAEIRFGAQSTTTPTARSKSVLGHATTVLGAGSSNLIDTVNNVEVQLVGTDQWITSCDDEALAAGTNLAVIGNEVVQFGTATSLGGGRFRLSRLLRGRGGSEWAQGEHAAGDNFCLLRPGTVQAIELPDWSIGAEVSATLGAGTAAGQFGGESMRPPSPVRLRAETIGSGDLKLNWTRRSRRGFAWIDGVDAPIGEALERYRVVIVGPDGALEFSTAVPELLVSAATLASVGSGVSTIEVVQVGDLLTSRPEKLDIVIS